MKIYLIGAAVVIIILIVYFVFYRNKGDKPKKKVEKSSAGKFYKEFHEKFKTDLTKEEFMEKTGDDGLLYIYLRQIYDIAALDGYDSDKVDKEITEKEYANAIKVINL